MNFRKKSSLLAQGLSTEPKNAQSKNYVADGILPVFEKMSPCPNSMRRRRAASKFRMARTSLADPATSKKSPERVFRIRRCFEPPSMCSQGQANFLMISIMRRSTLRFIMASSKNYVIRKLITQFACFYANCVLVACRVFCGRLVHVLWGIVLWKIGLSD